MNVQASFAKYRECSSASRIVLASLLGLKMSGADFQPLGDLPGGNVFSVATGVSADGTVVCGYSSSASSGTSYEAFRWTATSGMIGLGDLAGGTFTSFASAISSDGSTVVGYSSSASGDQAFRWTQTGGMVGLGDLPGGNTYSLANAVSADGSVVVGYSSSTLSGTRDEAFRWTPADGMTGLGDLAGGVFNSRAWGVSADGSVIVGESTSSNGSESFRWTGATGMVGLGDLAGGNVTSIAYGVSADGLAVVGYGSPDGSGTHEAFRWTAGTGMVGLGFLPCDTWTIARAVSGDGSVIVGDPQTSSYKCVFIWDAQQGLRELQSVLSNDYGLNLSGWQLGRATAITPDGNVIVGYGRNPSGQTEAWMANIAPPALRVRRIGDNVALSWTTNAPGFTLQSASNLVSSNWMNSTNVPVVVGPEVTVVNSASNNAQYYRLKK